MVTLTIDLTAAQAQRVSTAIGKVLSLGRDATAAEIRQWLVDRLKDVVLKQEKKDRLDSVETLQPPDIV